MKTTSILLLIAALMVGIPKLSAQEDTWKAPKYANDLKNPLKGDESAIADGKKIFNQMCAICHGTKGKGNGAAGQSLDPKPSNFLSLNVRNESDGTIFWKLTEGRPPMASYKDLLTENQRWMLVNYIRELENK